MNNWKSFVSLSWYQETISFAFRLASYTSEPLLVASLVFSAADVISKGFIGEHNIILNVCFAIATSVAIEAGGGISLVAALEARREQDKIKAILYFILSFFLAVTGGIMLFLQLTGWENQGNSPFMLFLFVLRCIASIGFVYLCRTKHIRFSGQAPIQADQIQPTPQISIEEIRAIIQETITNVVTNMTVQVAQIEQAQPQTVVVAEPVIPDPVIEEEPKKIATTSTNNLENLVRVKTFLDDHPSAKIREIASSLGISTSTAGKWVKYIRDQEI